MLMSRTSSIPSRFVPCLVAGILLFAGSLPTRAQCVWSASHTPATGVPSALWGNLQPTDTGQLPGNRDSTDYQENGANGGFEGNPYWAAVDAEGGYVFAAAGRTIQIWNATTNPGSPSVEYNIGLSGLTSIVPALVWTPDAHAFIVFNDIDAPPNNSNIFAMVGQNGVGTAIFDSTNKQGTRLVYQDHGANRYAGEVYAGSIGGRDYAFAAAYQGGGGVYAYDMTAAASLTTACIEAQPGSAACPGVYKGKIGTRNRVDHIDGAGNFIIFSEVLGSPKGFEIWNVTNPSVPVNVMNGLPTESIYSVAMWQQGASYYAAVRTLTQARIYNVSCIASGACSPGAPLWSQTLRTASTGTLTFSRSGSTPFLYIGESFECLSGNQSEYLLDVSSPSAPTDISPQGTAVINGQSVSYWGWYYWDNGVHGFNRFQPRAGKFGGNYFYRAGKTFFDIHQRTGGSAPAADFSFSPTEIYPGTPITFTDQTIGSPIAWSWSFQPDGSPSTSTTRNPSGVEFSTQGSKTVSLMATNAVGSDTEVKTLQVLNPAPAVANVTATPTSALLCQPVTFTAVGVTGEPTLTYSWVVQDPSQTTVATGPNSPQFVWESDESDTTGVQYTATVSVSNSSPTVASASSPGVSLNALVPLPASGAFAPTYPGQPSPPPTGTVTFTVAAAGATEWNWNFGDNPGGGPMGDGYEGWTSDPIAGPNPTHSYLATGLYDVRAKVRNCLESERESSAVSLEIISVVQLEASFSVAGLVCGGGVCSVDVDQSLDFVDSSTGGPTAWDYDWNGDGSFEDSNNTSAVTSHTYTSQGSFRPVLRVRRGGALDTFTHTNLIQVGTAPPPAGPLIVVTGPTSGTIGQQLTYAASASNCTPSGTGWSWTTTGGSASGPTNGSTINLSWSSGGSKTVRATNNTCGTASGTRVTTINTGTGGGSLAANFTFTPSSPEIGDTVTFNASSSTGSPGSYTWKSFGDGSPGESGVNVTHVYSSARSFQVTLEVARTDDPSCPPFNICTADITKTVLVGGIAPPPAVDARFNVDVPCVAVSGGEFCEVETDQVVTFTDASIGEISSRNWTFGDGAAATGATTTHSWGIAGTYVVTLTVSDGETSDAARKTFNVTMAPPPPEPEDKRVLLPWSSKSDAALDQVTSLFVHNPDSEPRVITMRFHLRRAASDSTPPLEHEISLAAGATAAFPDVLGDPFGLNNVTGFLEFEVEGEGAVLPTVVAYHRTFLADGTSFGQVVPAVQLGDFPKSSVEDSTLLHLQGLNDDTERLAFFGITNPNDSVARYRLHFYNSLGESIGTPPAQLSVGPMNLQQLQVERIRNEFGISEVSDYRVEVEVLSDDPVYLYGTNLRKDTLDPAFLRAGDPTVTSVMLLGALAAEGLNGALFRTDAVVANVSDETVETQVIFTNVGIGAVALEPIVLTLRPGETVRLRNVLQDRWGLPSTGNLGFLIFTSLQGPLPLIQAETYDVANPNGRFGQFMPALTEGRIAQAGERQILTGLQQDANFRTTIWMVNPGQTSGEYDLIYRALNGSVLGRIDGYRVPPGNMRQLGPAQHPLPDGVAEGGFTVQIIVRQGQLVSASQGVDNATNDPKFIAGRTR